METECSVWKTDWLTYKSEEVTQIDEWQGTLVPVSIRQRKQWKDIYVKLLECGLAIGKDDLAIIVKILKIFGCRKDTGFKNLLSHLLAVQHWK